LPFGVISTMHKEGFCRRAAVLWIGFGLQRENPQRPASFSATSSRLHLHHEFAQLVGIYAGKLRGLS
jgi:hypothetical protein